MTLLRGLNRSTPATAVGVRHPATTVGLVFASLMLLLLTCAAFFPHMLTTGDPTATNAMNVLAHPSAEHWFGTDQSGRDVYTRVIYGTATSLQVGLQAVGIALLAGVLVGTLAGMAPTWLDAIIVRFIEIIMAFPEFLIALLVVAIIGKGPTAVALGVTISIIPAYVRLARITARRLKISGPYEASRLLGVHPARATIRHIMPNVSATLVGLAVVGFGSAIVSAAGLSFLGLGVQPPTPEWGLMMSEGKNQLAGGWWISVFPGLALACTVIAVTVLARPLQRFLEDG
ncbi:ABC transporter permease [Timonella sp. A28]|uniref:ABC transporter permease n=1 Tax=Timonella sp. A28 TaxID=3442640 RepID=UPI003EBAEC9D